jgi:branched-chain amino acid transport system permease protein
MIGGGIIPVFYLYLMLAAALIAALLWFVLTKTRLGKVVRAAAHNPTMTSLLGINTSLVYAAVFALGGLLAGTRQEGLLHQFVRCHRVWGFQS